MQGTHKRKSVVGIAKHPLAAPTLWVCQHSVHKKINFHLMLGGQTEQQSGAEVVLSSTER